MCSLKFNYSKGYWTDREIIWSNDPKKVGMAILTPNKVNFRAQKVTRDEDGHLHNDKKASSPRRHHNAKCVRT